MLILSRKPAEEVVIQVGAAVQLRGWIGSLPITDAQRANGLRLLQDLEQTELQVMVTDVIGDRVRLGFTAPKSFAIHRREVWDLVQQGQGRRALQPL